MIYDKNTKAHDRLKIDYNIYGTPTLYWDGGYKLDIGASSVEYQKSKYTSSINDCGSRSVKNVDIELNAYWIGGTNIKVECTVLNNEQSKYDGTIWVYIVEKVSSMDWKDTNGNLYTMAFLDWAFNEPISIPVEAYWSKSTIWDGSSHGYNKITKDNTLIIAAVFNSEWHQGYSYPPSGYPFDAYYVDKVVTAEYDKYINGIDVSDNQGKIDWEKVAKDDFNVKFTFIRTTYGDDQPTLLFDKLCSENINSAKDKINVSVYHFGYPDYKGQRHEAEKEANWTVNFSKRYMHNGFMIPALDIEDDDKSNAHPKNLKEDGLAQWIIDYMENVTKKTKDITTDGSGIKPLLYINNDYATFLNKADEKKVNKLKEYNLWFATWRCSTENPPTGDTLVIWKNKGWNFWQYYGFSTDGCSNNKGFIDGINVD